jgi:hypothetical protein
MSGGHFSTGGSGSSLDDAALKHAFLIATLPSCGSRAGLIGPDVQRDWQQQQQQQQLIAGVSLVGDSGSGAKAVLLLLPVPLQRLLVGLAGLLVTAGLMSGERRQLPLALAILPQLLGTCNGGEAGTKFFAARTCTPDNCSAASCANK